MKFVYASLAVLLPTCVAHAYADPAPNLEALIGDQAEKITPNEIKSEAVRCGSEFKEKGQQVTELGQRLVEREKQQRLQRGQQNE